MKANEELAYNILAKSTKEKKSENSIIDSRTIGFEMELKFL
jgi:hypothetical protein